MVYLVYDRMRDDGSVYGNLKVLSEKLGLSYSSLTNNFGKKELLSMEIGVLRIQKVNVVRSKKIVKLWKK